MPPRKRLFQRAAQKRRTHDAHRQGAALQFHGALGKGVAESKSIRIAIQDTLDVLFDLLRIHLKALANYSLNRQITILINLLIYDRVVGHVGVHIGCRDVTESLNIPTLLRQIEHPHIPKIIKLQRLQQWLCLIQLRRGIIYNYLDVFYNKIPVLRRQIEALVYQITV